MVKWQPTPLEQRAIAIAKVPNWYPWIFQRAANGIICKGAVCPLITKGPRKGMPNYRKADRSTVQTVVVPLDRPGVLKSR